MYVQFANANTGASSIKLDALAALPIKLNGGDLGLNSIRAGAVKLLLLASDSSHYQLQSSAFDLPSVASGEKVMTQKADGLHVDYDVIDSNSGTLTTGAQLAAMDWTAGVVSKTGIKGEDRFYNGYYYICTGTNTWYRVPFDLIIREYILGNVDDTAGKKTMSQMNALFPDAVAPQIVYGVMGKYEYTGSNVWMYFENKI